MSHRRARYASLAAVLSAGLLVGVGATAGPAWETGPRTSVIVQTTGDTAPARAAVRRLGGAVTVELPIVGGFAVDLPAGAVPALERTTGVRAVTPNTAVHLNGTGDNTGDGANSVYAREINADKAWQAGVTGRGVRVALIDTGVSPVRDLAGRIVRVADPRDRTKQVDCINFSGEPTCGDSYGHGTFIAGLIAGNGADSGGLYTGVAPESEIVSVKIAGRDGSADVTKLLAAIQWVVSFKDTYGIRVLNLSLGTDSRASYRIDPLNYAVQRAWRSGITVVVAASNRGPAAGTISKPADDPLVVTVGAVDDRETPSTNDDRLPNFSGRGPTAADGLAKPDVVAPGGRLVSLRSPGSLVEELAPGGGPDAIYRRGSGTSMSAAVVSGAAALLAQAEPSWAPDRVKFALAATAIPVATPDRMAVGSGLIDVQRARNAVSGLANAGLGTLSDATGSLDGARGSVFVTATCGFLEKLIDPQCDRVHGNETGQNRAFDVGAFRQEWTGNSWYASQWSGNSWYGSSWYGNSWYGTSWYGNSWYGDVDDDLPYGIGLPGSAWLGAW